MAAQGRSVFYSVEDLESWAGSAITKEDSKETLKLVKRFADALVKNLRKHIDSYYASYSPKSYVRTDNLRKSLDNISFTTAQKMFPGGGAVIECSFSFDEDMAKSVSIFGKSEYEGNRVDLIQGGWQVKKDVWFKDKEHFGFQKGYDFIGKAIDDTYKEIVPNDIIEVEVDGARNSSVL